MPLLFHFDVWPLCSIFFVPFNLHMFQRTAVVMYKSFQSLNSMCNSLNVAAETSGFVLAPSPSVLCLSTNVALLCLVFKRN